MKRIRLDYENNYELLTGKFWGNCQVNFEDISNKF